MSLILRFLWTLLLSPFQKRVSLLDETSLTFTTMPDDLDYNGHMNNGRYLSIMDFGRLNQCFRLGIVIPMLKRGWLPVVASAQIRYRKSLRPFDRFTLRTKIIGWDEKWLYMEQSFLHHGDVMATGMIKGVFRGKLENGKIGSIPTSKLLDVIGIHAESPALPEKIRAV